MSNLAIDLGAMGEHAAARDLHQKTLEIRRRVLGPEHPRTLTSMTNLAINLRMLSEPAGARDIDQQTLERDE